MELFKRLIKEEDGQGLVEYTLIVLLVALVFWVAVRESGVGDALTNGWEQITDCVTTPDSCEGFGGS